MKIISPIPRLMKLFLMLFKFILSKSLQIEYNCADAKPVTVAVVLAIAGMILPAINFVFIKSHSLIL